MDKRQLTRIEKELAKLLPDDGADQARVDKLRHDLNKIYGDGTSEVPPMTADEFNKTVESLMAQYGMKKIKPE